MKVQRVARPVTGFRAAGLHSGIKAKGKDLALIVSDSPANAAAIFTTSTVVGAPVTVSRERVKSGRARGVVVNSGCSNVSMGARGIRDAEAMSRLAAKAIGCDESEMLVASTGVIGEPLPMAALRKGVPRAAEKLSADGFEDAAEAIRTTDTHAKAASIRFKLDGVFVTLQGIAKGSGMIEPDMATMLSFLTTDAKIAAGTLRGMLKRVAAETYNCLTVDGEGSTSDTVVLLANGAAGGPAIRGGSDSARAFESALHAVCEDLVRQMARDGEGATKLVTVEVEGARTPAEAKRAARRIANSMLVKTAVFGGDPNWGRIMQTIGAEKIAWHEEKTRVRVGPVVVFSKGRSAGTAARKRAEKALAAEEVALRLDLGLGDGSARVFTCDLTYDYVKINAEYTT